MFSSLGRARSIADNATTADNVATVVSSCSPILLKVRDGGIALNNREDDASDGDACLVGKHVALDFDHAADGSNDASTRIKPLVRPCTGRKFEWSDSGNAKSARGAVSVSRHDESTCLRKQLDQHNRRDHRIAGKMALEVPVVRSCDTQTASRFAVDEIRNLLDKPHRRLMRKQVDVRAT